MERPQFISLDLRNVSFKDRNLATAIFRGCDLRGTDFSGANLDSAEMLYCDLRGTKFGKVRSLQDISLLGNVYQDKTTLVPEKLAENNIKISRKQY